MKIENIEVADIPLEDTIKKDTEILFVFPKVYIVDKQKYVEKCTLTIKNWKRLDAIAIIAESTTSFKNIMFDFNQMEKFDLIQEISQSDDNSLTLKGYSRESNKWLEYSFVKCDYEIRIDSE